MNTEKWCRTCGGLMTNNSHNYDDCVNCNPENFFNMLPKKEAEVKKLQEIKDPIVEKTEKDLSTEEDDDESLGKPII